MNSTPERLSLLFPANTPSDPAAVHLSDRVGEDLGLSQIAGAMAMRGVGLQQIAGMLSTPATETHIIRYRQSIVADLAGSEHLQRGLAAIIPKVQEVTTLARGRDELDSPFLRLVWRLGELEVYVQLVRELDDVLGAAELRSEGLVALSRTVSARRKEPTFRTLERRLPEIRAGIKRHSSVTIGINLDDKYRPVEATLLSVNDRRFRHSSLLARLFGMDGTYHTNTSLHATPIPKALTDRPASSVPLAPLFQDLNRMLKSVSRPLADEVDKYVRVNTQFVSGLVHELGFLLGAVSLMRRLADSGLPVCLPTIAEPGERVLRAQESYNVHLALRLLERNDDPRRIVLNDVCLDDSARLFILTGPNQGGKTTYTQGLGVLQILGQAGLFVPARSAVLSPVDHVESHFPSEEKGALETGRLAEEAKRLSAMFDRITDRSLVLLNETLSSTSPGEGLYLAEDVVKGLRLSGARGVFTTHLHELAERAEVLNAEVNGASRIGSLVAGVGAAADRPGGETRRTYRVRQGPPMGKSYARDIAERYGISFQKIRRRLQDRGTPPSEEHTGG